MSKPAIQGRAALFNKPIVHKGEVKVFIKGAFDEVISSGKEVRLQLDHDDDLVVGSTEDGRLELRADDRGVAVRFALQDDGIAEMVAERKFDGVSVGCAHLYGYVKEVEDEPVKFITKADLDEVSLVTRGAVKQAFATVVDADYAPPLSIDMKSASFASEGAFRHLMRVLEDRMQ